MVVPIHICCGTTKEPHGPVRMKVDKNDISIYRKGGTWQRDEYEPGPLVMFEEVDAEQEWFLNNYPRKDKLGTNRNQLFIQGGEYYGDGDRMVCPICGATIVWR